MQNQNVNLCFQIRLSNDFNEMILFIQRLSDYTQNITVQFIDMI